MLHWHRFTDYATISQDHEPRVALHTQQSSHQSQLSYKNKPTCKVPILMLSLSTISITTPMEVFPCTRTKFNPTSSPVFFSRAIAHAVQDPGNFVVECALFSAFWENPQSLLLFCRASYRQDPLSFWTFVQWPSFLHHSWSQPPTIRLYKEAQSPESGASPLGLYSNLLTLNRKQLNNNKPNSSSRLWEIPQYCLEVEGMYQ